SLVTRVGRDHGEAARERGPVTAGCARTLHEPEGLEDDPIGPCTTLEEEPPIPSVGQAELEPDSERDAAHTDALVRDAAHATVGGQSIASAGSTRDRVGRRDR